MTAVTVRVWLAVLLCAAGASHAADTLYARLGGEAGVAAICNELIDRAVANPTTGPSFKDTKVNRIKRLLAEQICDLSGGPCHYSGDPMKDVHAGHHITEAQFYALVEDLSDILRERHVDLRSRNQLLRLLAPMKRDVVEPASAPRAAAPGAAAPGAKPVAPTNPQ